MKMKKIWVALLLAGMSFGMGSCTKEDIDDIRKELQEHNDRLTSLEEWQKSVNTSISYLQSLIEALEDKDYVTAVTPLEDGTGYVISFLKSGNVTIKHGEKGEKGEDGNTPVISVKLDTDGKYYWTVNGEWLLDSGNKIPVTETNGADVQTRSTGSRWGVSVTKPTFETDGALVEGSAKVTIKGTEDTHLADTYLLRVALVTANGTEVTASRLVKYFDGTIVEKQSDITDNTVSRLAWKGDMAEDDFAYIRNNMASTLEVLDLSATTLTELPTRALAFYSAQGYNGNNTLHTVILPESLVKTGWAAFGNCNNLQHVYLPSALTEITNWTFEMCYKLADVEIPRHVNTIGEGAFSNCRDLAEIRIPASVTAIPNWCFQLCMNLEQIYLHDGITSIGQAAFSSCPSLDHFTVPKGVTVLSENLFASCHGLREVYLHDGITAMKEGVFYCCTSLTYCTFPDYGENSLPVGLTEIGQNCFYNTALKQINMSGTQIKDIPDWAFYTCENLKEVAFPYDLETIGINAFSGCPFTSIVLPASLTEIRAWAFSSCNDLRFVECQATTPPILNEGSPFPNRVFKLTVPTGCADAYKDTSWNNYFENIQ